MAKIRNILLIGKTGKGKSTLANVLTNSDKFRESANTKSATKDIKIEDFIWEGINYRVIDTVGFDDTSLSEEEVYRRVAKAAYAVREGINQVLYVINGRLDKDEVKTFNRVKTYILGSGVTNYVTIVRTNAAQFKNEDWCRKDYSELVGESSTICDLLKSCHGFIHVNNPSLEDLSDSDEEGRNKAVQKAEKRRKESREKLLGHLKNNCHGYYTHEILERVNEKIKDLMVELAAENAAMEKDEQKIKQLEKQISEEVKAEVEVCCCRIS